MVMLTQTHRNIAILLKSKTIYPRTQGTGDVSGNFFQ